MYRWILLILVLPVLWAGYWLFGSSNLKSGLKDWLAQREMDGWQVEYADLGVRGFPNRFDMTLSDVQLTDPEAGISWSAPFFQMLSLSYRPNHVIAVWPNSQSFATPYQKIDVTSESLKASVFLSPSAALTLDRGTVVAEDLQLISSTNWDLKTANFSSSVRQLGNPNVYEFAVDLNRTQLSGKLRKWIEAQENLPQTIEVASARITTRLTAPIDRRMIEEERPQVKSLEISELKASWGDLLLRAAGELDVAEGGLLTGDIVLNAKNWREMLNLAVLAGAISDEVASAAEFGLGLMARLNGSEATLDVTLSFRDGSMSLGVIPLGPAPRLVIR